jgi:hypothetical protein
LIQGKRAYYQALFQVWATAYDLDEYGIAIAYDHYKSAHDAAVRTKDQIAAQVAQLEQVCASLGR